MTPPRELTGWWDCVLALSTKQLEVEVLQRGGNASEVNQIEVVGSESFRGALDEVLGVAKMGGETKKACSVPVSLRSMH